MRKPTRRELKLILAALLVGAVGIPAIGWRRGWFESGRPAPVEVRVVKDALSDPRFNEDVQDGDVQSEDLGADIKLMWETTDGNPETGRVSTARAINAANRVFNTVQLVGKTGAEVKALLGSPIHSNDSVYRGAAFHEIKARAMIYRFDNGNYGWQINVYCQADDQPVTEVEKLWIH